MARGPRRSVRSRTRSRRREGARAEAASRRGLAGVAASVNEQHSRPPSAARRRRERLDPAMKLRFRASCGTYGSPWARAQIRRDGRRVSTKTVEASMARLGLNACLRRRRRGLVRPDKAAVPAPTRTPRPRDLHHHQPPLTSPPPDRADSHATRIPMIADRDFL